jgi:hypothetical protein
MFDLLRKWFAKPSATKGKARRAPSVRLGLETLEERCVPTIVVAGYFVGDSRSAAGVYRYTDSTRDPSRWQLLTTAYASQVSVDSQADVAMEIPGQGVWRYSANGDWTHVTGVDANQVGVYDHGIVGNFPGQGTFRWDDRTGWTHLTPVDATILKADDYGDVVGSYPGYGVWRGNINAYDGQPTTWGQINYYEAAQLAISPNGASVVADFPGQGVWRDDSYFGGWWSQVSATDSVSLDINSNGTVAASFADSGTYTYSPAGTRAQVEPGTYSDVHFTDNGKVGIDRGYYGSGMGLAEGGESSWGGTWERWSNLFAPGDATTFDMK